jgi:TolA-binding protein
VSGKVQERQTVIASLRSQINELHGKIREKKVRTQAQERQVQQLHESVIGFQERCRQMTEIVRAKKLQK